MITYTDILKIIYQLLRFPYSQICIHNVAGRLLDLLERKGFPLSQELAKAVVSADDETALKILGDLIVLGNSHESSTFTK